MVKRLIRLELKRVTLKSHFLGLLIANIIILFLSLFISALLGSGEFQLTAAGFPVMQLTTITIASMFVRMTLIIWEAVLIAVFILEEYRNKTMLLLFTYPVSRIRLILSKVLLVCGIIFVFYICSGIFQHICIFLFSKAFHFVTYDFENLFIQLIVAVATTLTGLIPLCIGMIKKSTIATIVSSLVIVSVVSNSQGSSAGLLSVPIIAVLLGITGIAACAVTVRKMAASDLYN